MWFPDPRAVRRQLAAVDILLLTSVLWLLAKLLRYAYPPLFGTFRESLGVSNATLGLAFTGMMLCYAAMQFPAGAVGDRYGYLPVVVLGALVAAVAGLFLGSGVAMTVGIVGVVLSMILVGIGTGGHKTLSMTVLSQVYDRQGRALGVLDTFGTFGGVLAPLLVVVAIATPAIGWEGIYFGAGIAGVAVAALLARRGGARVGPEMATSGRPDSGVLNTRVAVRAFADPRLFGFVVVTVLFSFAYNGVVAFLPSYLEVISGLSTSTAGFVYAGFFAVSLVQPISGMAADRWGTLPVIAVTLVVTTIGLIAMVLTESALAASIAALGIGAGSHGFRPVRGAHLVTVAPPATTAGTVGIARTALMGAGALAPGVVGAIAATADLRAAFLPLAIALIAAAVGSVLLAVSE